MAKRISRISSTESLAQVLFQLNSVRLCVIFRPHNRLLLIKCQKNTPSLEPSSDSKIKQKLNFSSWTTVYFICFIKKNFTSTHCNFFLFYWQKKYTILLVCFLFIKKFRTRFHREELFFSFFHVCLCVSLDVLLRFPSMQSIHVRLQHGHSWRETQVTDTHWKQHATLIFFCFLFLFF